MSHESGKVDKQSIKFNDYRFLVENTIDESLVNIGGRKVNQGDPGPDDHPINSTWIQSDWTGGGQVHDGDPDVSTGRFDFATCETMQAHAIALAPDPYEWDDPATSGNASMMLGVYEDQVWAAWGSDIRVYNPGTDAWDNLAADLSAAPVGKGQVFTASTGALTGDPIFCIPLGSSFDYINGVTRTNVAKAAVDLCVMDGKLFRLAADGSFEWTTDLSTWYGLTYVPDDSTPRHLNVYLTVGGEPTVYVTTSSAVFAYDVLSGRLYQTQLQFPKHPDQGKASCVWRSDFYTSVGDGVHRYNRSTIAAMGLDRDDGLPEQYRGVIVDMEPSYNAIYALVSGSEAAAAAVQDETILFAGDDYMTAGQGTVYGLLMKWNGFGWHYVHAFSGTAPTTVIVSDADDDYAVWWAANNKVFKINLSRTYMNLKDDSTTSNPPVSSGTFETCWYSFGWKGQIKILKSFECYTRATDGGRFNIYYKVDDDNAPWVFMRTAYGTREHAFYFGRESGASSTSDDPNDYSGVACERVKIKIEFFKSVEDNPDTQMVVEWFSVIARKMLRPNRTMRMVLNLDTTNDYTSDQLREVLLTAIKTPEAATLEYHNEILKVDLVALEFRTMPDGSDITYIAKVNFIESQEERNIEEEATVGI